MSKGLEEMPLFPLDTVLFPHAVLQLHVFEERYRTMIQNCLEYERPFGIVLIRSGSEVGGPADPYLVGTACRVTEVTHLDGGAMDIKVQGERRFRIREFDESKPYLVGYVEDVIEHPHDETPYFDQTVSRICNVFESLIRIQLARSDFNVRVTFPSDPVELSFAMASLLTIENLAKQKLLETTDTLERCEELLPVLEQQLLESQVSEISTRSPRTTVEQLRDHISLN